MNHEPILKARTPDGACWVEVYTLNPGSRLVPFGGSKPGLVVGKTASLVIRTGTGWGIRDVEYDINDKEAWDYIFGSLATGVMILDK